MTRRDFLQKSALALGAAAVAGETAAFAYPLEMPIGFQVYTIKDLLVKDFPGTLKQMADLGYRTVEMCSPPGYVSSGFEPLTKLKAPAMRAIIHEAGLTCESCHYSFQELQETLDDRLAFAKELGLKQMVASGFWLKAGAKLADWQRASDELNKIGERVAKAGMQLVFHNHHFEFEHLEGALIYDAIMEQLDPRLVKMQFQVAVVNIGYQAATYFVKYPGRFQSLHLSDWSADGKTAVPIGKGVVNWTELFSIAKVGGVKNYFVEMGLDTLKPSAEYLKELKV
jgi:sugar phosphate isomerase/epimerase